MKTCVVFLEYRLPCKVQSSENYEHALIGDVTEGATYPTVHDFLLALEKLYCNAGSTLMIKNVVIG